MGTSQAPAQGSGWRDSCMKEVATKQLVKLVSHYSSDSLGARRVKIPSLFENNRVTPLSYFCTPRLVIQILHEHTRLHDGLTGAACPNAPAGILYRVYGGVDIQTLLLDGCQSLDVVHLGLVLRLRNNGFDVVVSGARLAIEQTVDVFEAAGRTGMSVIRAGRSDGQKLTKASWSLG